MYATDVRPVAGKVRVIRFPAAAQPDVVYEAAVAAKPRDLEAAQAFLIALLDTDGRRALRGRLRPTAVNRLFGALLWAATVLALAFLVLPIASIFLRIPPSDLLSALGSDVARDAFVVTLERRSSRCRRRSSSSAHRLRISSRRGGSSGARCS